MQINKIFVAVDGAAAGVYNVRITYNNSSSTLSQYLSSDPDSGDVSYGAARGCRIAIGK